MTAIRFLADRAVISVTGAEARAFLQRVVTADIDQVSTGAALPAALLTPQGKLLVDFLVFAAEDGVWLDAPAEAADALVKRLTLYRLRAKAEIGLRPDMAALWSSDRIEDGAPDPRHPALGWRAIGPQQGEPGDHEVSALEIRHGVPAWGRDYGEAEVFPTDVNLDLQGGIGWKKGCFIGQEVVSRMKRRGTIRKRSLALAFDGVAPGKGSRVEAGGSGLGEITSSHAETAIALIRLDRLDAAEGAVTAGGSDVARIARPEN